MLCHQYYYYEVIESKFDIFLDIADISATDSSYIQEAYSKVSHLLNYELRANQPCKETTFDNNIHNLQLALANLSTMADPMAGMGGLDSPGSQCESIYQMLTGVGRELTPPIKFTDQDEIPQVPLGQDSPLVIYHFIHPSYTLKYLMAVILSQTIPLQAKWIRIP